MLTTETLCSLRAWDWDGEITILDLGVAPSIFLIDVSTSGVDLVFCLVSCSIFFGGGTEGGEGVLDCDLEERVSVDMNAFPFALIPVDSLLPLLVTGLEDIVS